jgi:hypothetical protein
MNISSSRVQPLDVSTEKYISLIAHELRIMAYRSNLGFLAYLLAMVEQEATDLANRMHDAEPQRRHAAESKDIPPGMPGPIR